MKKDQKQSEIDSARKITAIVNKLRNSENNFKALNKRYSDSENARTLYNIQQEKEISDLKQNVRSLNKRVAVLEGTIRRLTDENSSSEIKADIKISLSFVKPAIDGPTNANLDLA